MKKQVSKMNDKELDDFFKKLSSDPEIPYDPQDWDRFEKIISANKVVWPLNGYKGFLLGFLLLFGLIFTVWLTASNSRFQTGDKDVIQPAPSSMQTELDSFDESEVKIPARKKPSIGFLENENVTAMDTVTKNLNQTPIAAPLPDKSQTKGTAQVPHLEWDPDSKWSAFEEFNRKLSIVQNVGIYERSLIQFDPIASSTQQNRIALGIMVAPDISAIQFDHFPSSGRSIGFSLGYFIGDSWSLSIGVVHGQKKYRDGRGYWEGYDTAHQALIGDCWLIEIPVNLRYYPINGPKDRWFISSGLSSYFMVKEKYSLTYENYSGDSYTREMEIKGNNQHVFGVWNVGLGYERKVGKKITIQAEPYLRMPLVGIGEGNLDLKSLGIFFGINYYPSNKLLRF